MSEYSPYDDAFAVIGRIITEPDAGDLQSRDLAEIIDADSEDDYLDLVAVLGAIAAGLADVITDGDPQLFMQVSAQTRPYGPEE